MGLQIISAEQRLAEKRGHKIVVCGASGVGKTTLATTLDPKSTLFMECFSIKLLSVIAGAKNLYT